MERRKRLHTSNPFWADENADVVETAMVEIDTDGAEYRETGGAEDEGLKVGGADNNPMGLRARGTEAPDGAEELAGHERLLQVH